MDDVMCQCNLCNTNAVDGERQIIWIYEQENTAFQRTKNVKHLSNKCLHSRHFNIISKRGKASKD